jgi:sulfite exporter TauE/SafE
MWWAALLFGFVGSLHCVGMCGPIAMLVQGRGRGSFVLNRLLYNIGRTVTYAAMGFAVGWLGKLFNWSGYQNMVSIAAGILILIALTIPAVQARFFPAIGILVSSLKHRFAKYIRSTKPQANLALGILNGFLPCGLVYSALTLALVQATVWDSTRVMIFFGLGTIPALIGVVYSADKIIRLFPSAVRYAQTTLLVITAVIMIWRGIAIESGLDPVTGQVTTTCHTPAE